MPGDSYLSCPRRRLPRITGIGSSWTTPTQWSALTAYFAGYRSASVRGCGRGGPDRAAGLGEGVRVFGLLAAEIAHCGAIRRGEMGWESRVDACCGKHKSLGERLRRGQPCPNGE